MRWEQFKNWHFSRGYNFWTEDNILLLKTFTGPYSCLAKVIFCQELVLNLLFISCRLMKNVRFWTVPIWLLHTVHNPITIPPRESVGTNWSTPEIDKKILLILTSLIYLCWLLYLWLCLEPGASPVIDWWEIIYRVARLTRQCFLALVNIWTLFCFCWR